MAKPKPQFTIQDLQNELESALMPEGDGCTTRELSERLGVSRGTILDRLYRMLEDGRLEVVRKRVKAIDGRLGWSPAYRLKTKQEESPKAIPEGQ